MFVNVYEVTRHFGGHEEGGWWFNWFDCIETKEVSDNTKDDVLHELKMKYKKRERGNIYSVNGGIAYEVWLEDKPKESETKKAPIYE